MNTETQSSNELSKPTSVWQSSWAILRDAASQWVCDNAARLGASLAFYSILSIAPLLVIVIRVAGAVFGREAAQGQIVSQIEHLVGRAGADATEALIANAGNAQTGTIATVIGLVTLLFGASGVFLELSDSLNLIWEVRPKPGRFWWTIIKQRFLSFAMVLGVGFLLLVSLAVSAALNAAGATVQHYLQMSVGLAELLYTMVSLLVFAILFGLIFKILPEAYVPWRAAAIGGAVTAILFAIGKSLLGAYLGRASFISVYGAAGSFVVLIVWVYYSAQILYFGAELTHELGLHFAGPVQPSSHAVLRSA